MLSQRSSTSLMRSSTVNCCNFVSIVRASFVGTQIGYAAAARKPLRFSAEFRDFGIRSTTPSACLENRNHVGAVLELVQGVCPGLHHFPALPQMPRPVAGASVRIAHRVRELVLDEIRPE